MPLSPAGRLFQYFTLEKANDEGIWERDFETWKFDKLPRVLCECVSDREDKFERK